MSPLFQSLVAEVYQDHHRPFLKTFPSPAAQPSSPVPDAIPFTILALEVGNSHGLPPPHPPSFLHMGTTEAHPTENLGGGRFFPLSQLCLSGGWSGDQFGGCCAGEAGFLYALRQSLLQEEGSIRNCYLVIAGGLLGSEYLVF